jgi:hypothetical protein
MAMAIAMRIAAYIFFATKVTQGMLLDDYDTHIKRTSKPHYSIFTYFEDTTKMGAPSRDICQVTGSGVRQWDCLIMLHQT